jgi:hypothetical protein
MILTKEFWAANILFCDAEKETEFKARFKELGVKVLLFLRFRVLFVKCYIRPIRCELFSTPTVFGGCMVKYWLPVMTFCIVLSACRERAFNSESESKSAAAPQLSQTFRDNVGSDVQIETKSWTNSERDVKLRFSGAKLVEQLSRNCYPSGTAKDTNADGISDLFLTGGIIRVDSANGTLVGIAYERGESLCSLSWSGPVLQLKSPNGDVLWNFDNI